MLQGISLKKREREREREEKKKKRKEEKTLQGKISFLVEQPLSKEGLKMFTGLQGQKILYTTSFVAKVCRKILVSIRAKLLECLG